MSAESRTINANGVKLRIREWATDKSPTVLLVHGYPDASHVWDKTAAKLAEHYHVVAYDVRGAGESDAPKHTKAYELEHLVADLRMVLDAVSPDAPVHLVAHDWGSIQCWEAVTDPAFADRIDSYTSMSGPCLDHAGYWIAQRLKSGKPDEIGQVAGQFLHSWYIGAFHLPFLAPAAWKSGLDKLWPSLLERIEGIETETAPTQRADGSHGVKLYRANMLERLASPQEKRTDIPVQLIVPTHDRFVTPDLLDDLPQWAPNLWRRDVDAGHWLQMSHPELVARYVREFVDFHEAGGDEQNQPSALRRARVTGERKPYSGKLVVVTGAGGGIGRETLLNFAEQGAEVVAVDLDPEANRRTAELAELLGATAHHRELDVGDTGAMEALADWVETELGAPDIVVNNAGVGLAGGFLDTEPDDWEKLLRVNLWGVIHGARLFGRQMLAEGKSGHIVNVASAAAYAPARTLTAYATTKAAVRMLSECMRADLADKDIRVISVCPGFINTNITRTTRFVGKSAEEEERQQARATSLYARRNLGPRAVANAILRAIETGRDEAPVGIEAHGMNWLGRFAPGLARRLARMDLTG